MAESILRLRVNSEEYDNKIKRAVNGLMQMETECRKVGGTLAILEKDQLDYVKSLGNMETVSRTARGRISELSNAYVELAVQYKRLTDEEKKGDYGKALSASLDQLKTRINDAKKELSDVDKELGNTGKESDALGGIVDKLAGKFGISTSALGVWGAALAAGTVALDVAKDAFFASEQNIDDWNRTVYSAQSTYQAFVTALNTGDVSGFLNNINTIVNAASEAYNALDRLGTMQSIQSPQVAKKQSEIQRFETMLRTGRYIAPADGRSTGGMKTGDVLTAEQKQNIAKNLSSAINEVAGLTKNEVKASTDAINALYKEQAGRLGMSSKQFQEGTASMAAFEENLEKARKYQEFEAKHTTYKTYTTNSGTSYTVTDRDKAVNPYAAYKNWGVFKDDGELFQKIVQLIQQRSSQESQYYGNVGRAYRGINRAEGITPTGGGGGGRTSNVTKTEPWRMLTLPDSYFDVDLTSRSKKDVEKGMAWATKAYNNAGDEWSRAEYKGMIDRYKGALGDMALEGDIRNGALKGAFSYDFGKSLEDFGESKDKEESREENKLTEQISKLTSGISSIASGMKSMGIDLPDEINQVIGVIQGLTSIIEGVNAVISVFSTTAMTANTAALVANTAALTANSTVNAIPFFARGGIVPHAAGGYYVPGTHYSGDVTPVYANAGELILSKSQQNAIASELSGGNLLNNMHLSATIHGEDIILAVNNTSMRKGRGEFVTTKNR